MPSFFFPFTLGTLGRAKATPTPSQPAALPGPDYDPLDEIDRIIGKSRKDPAPEPSAPAPRATTAPPRVTTAPPKVEAPKPVTLTDPFSDIDTFLAELDAARNQPQVHRGTTGKPDVHLGTTPAPAPAPRAPRADVHLPAEAPKLPDMRPLPAHELEKRQPLASRPTVPQTERLRTLGRLADNILSPAHEVAPPFRPATLGESVGRGVDVAQQLGYSGVEALGEAVGSETLTEFGGEGRRRNQAEAAAVPRASVFDIDSPGDFVQWAKETIGEQIPIMGPMVAGSVTGAAVGSAVPVIGTTLGGLIGAFVPAATFGVGEVQSAIKERGEEHSSPGWAFVGGSAVAALDSVLPGQLGTILLRKFGREVAEEVATRALTKEVADGFIVRTAKGTAAGMATEGLTEALQGAVSEVSAAQGTGTPVDWRGLGTQMVEEGAAGALIGGLTAGAAAGVPSRAPISRSPAAAAGTEPQGASSVQVPPPGVTHPVPTPVAPTEAPASTPHQAVLREAHEAIDSITGPSIGERLAAIDAAAAPPVVASEAEDAANRLNQIAALLQAKREAIRLPDAAQRIAEIDAEIERLRPTVQKRVGRGSTVALPPEFVPVGEEAAYAGPDRRGRERIASPEEDAKYQRYRERYAAGERLGSDELRSDFAERQRVEDTREAAAVDEVEALAFEPGDEVLYKGGPATVLEVDRDRIKIQVPGEEGQRYVRANLLQPAEQPAAAPDQGVGEIRPPEREPAAETAPSPSASPAQPREFNPAQAVADLPGNDQIRSHPLGSALVALGDLRGAGGAIPVSRFSPEEQAAIRAAGVHESTQISEPDEDGDVSQYQAFDESQLWMLREAYQNRGKPAPALPAVSNQPTAEPSTPNSQLPTPKPVSEMSNEEFAAAIMAEIEAEDQAAAGDKEPSVEDKEPSGPASRPAASQPIADWEDREEQIRASVKANKALGEVHLDSLPMGVEALRGRRFRSLRDGREWVVTTVDNRGTVHLVSPDGSVEDQVSGDERAEFVRLPNRMEDLATAIRTNTGKPPRKKQLEAAAREYGFVEPTPLDDATKKRLAKIADAANKNAGYAPAAQRPPQSRPTESRPAAPSTPISVKPHALEGELAEVQARAIKALEADPEGFKARYLKEFGRVLNADNASELFEEYAASDEARARLGTAVRAPAGALVDALFVDLLAQPTPEGQSRGVVFTAGGNASGKSSGISDEKSADIIFDSTLSSYEPSKANIDRALAAQRDVRIRYVYRDPVDALIHGAIPRALKEAKGRTVTVRGLAATHIGSRQTVLDLAKAYADNPRVTFKVNENTENSLVAQDLPWLEKQAYDSRDELERKLFDALDAEFSGRDLTPLEQAVYAGTVGVGRRVGEDRRGDGRRVREERGAGEGRPRGTQESQEVRGDDGETADTGVPSPRDRRQDAGGGEPRRRRRRGAQGPRVDPIAAAADAAFGDYQADARAQGFAGTDDELRAHFDRHVQSARSLIADLSDLHDKNGPDALLATIRALGGIRPFDRDWEGAKKGTKLRGDWENLVQMFAKFHGQRGGSSIFRTNGLPLDEMLQRLEDDPRFSHFVNDPNGFIRELEHIAMNPGETPVPDITRALRASGVVKGKPWWTDYQFIESLEQMSDEDLQAVGEQHEQDLAEMDAEDPEYRRTADRLEAIVAEANRRMPAIVGDVDILDTGEAQPRLPGAGAVREQDTATPEFDLPFSLTSESAKGLDAVERDLFSAPSEPEPEPARQPEPSAYSKDSMRQAFNLTEEQAEAVDALVEQMGLDTDQIAVVKGGTPGDGALRQDAPSAPPFYSRLQRAVEDSKTQRASGAQWKATIKNAKIGTNRDEYVFAHIDDLEDGRSYSRQEVLDYLKANEVRIQPVMLNDAGIDEYAAQLRIIRDAGYDVEGDPVDDDAELYLTYNGDPVEDDELTARRERIRREAIEHARETGQRYDPPEDEAEFRRAPREVWNALRAINEHRSSMDGRVRFASYVEPGADAGSYREVLLTAPADKAKVAAMKEAGRRLQEAERASAEAQRRFFQNDENAGYTAAIEKLERAQEAMRVAREAVVQWRDGHDQYDEFVNPVVRLRFNVRSTGDRRVLFLEEVQPPGRDEFKKMPALFQKHWREIGFKWALRYAAENGLDAVAWTSGQMQAARYSLEKHVQAITWGPVQEDNLRFSKSESEPTRDVFITIKHEDRHIDLSVEQDGHIVRTGLASGRELYGKALDEVIGKELAKRILEEPHGKIEGEGLKIGGQGLKKLYDVDFVNVVNSLPVVKRNGVKVGTTQIQLHPARPGAVVPFVEEFGFGRRTAPDTPAVEATVPAVELTPELRQAVLGGQPLFQGAKGAVEFSADGKALIRGLEAADVSTAVHEIAHVARRQLLNRNVPAEHRHGISNEDIDAVEHWTGADKDGWTVKAEEQFARGFERYLRDGNAPSESLVDVFKRLRDWLKDIYQRIVGSDLDVNITPAVREVFDKLVTRTERSRQPKAAPAKAQPDAPVAGFEPATMQTFGKDHLERVWYINDRVLMEGGHEGTIAGFTDTPFRFKVTDAGGRLMTVGASELKKRIRHATRDEWPMAAGPYLFTESGDQRSESERATASAKPQKADPEREALIERIVAASRKPDPKVVPSVEVKGTDGKWYRAHGNTLPWGVNATDEQRIRGYVIETEQGTTVGTTEPTEEAVLKRYRAARDKEAEEFRENLRERSPEDLEAAAEYWLTDQRALTLERHDDLMRRVYAGEAEPRDLRAAFRRVLEAKEKLRAELAGKTKDELLKRLGGFMAARYKSEKKAAVVDAAWNAILTDFVLGDSLSYSMGKNALENAVKAKVDAYTEADLKAFAEKVAEARAERAKRRDQIKKAITNPETLDEFDTFVRAHKDGEAALTPEQRAKYDELRAAAGRETRTAADRQRATVKAASEQVEASIVETTHTKKGYPLFVVQLAQRVERDDYNRLNEAAKKLGGWYSSFRGQGAVPGFQFKTREAADAFKALVTTGDTAAVQEAAVERRSERREAKKNAAAERLAEMADKLEEAANEKLSADRLVNTDRRARMAASAEAQARADIALARTLRNIADAIESGEATHLDGIRTKVQIETLGAIAERAKYERLRQQYPEWRDREKHQHRAVEDADIDLAEYPTVTATRAELLRAANAMLAAGAKQLDKRLTALAKQVPMASDDGVEGRVEVPDAIVAQAVAKDDELGKRGVLPWTWAARQADRRRLETAGIPDLPTLRVALREFIKYRGARPEADKVKALERELVGKDVGIDFFPTPAPLAAEMAEALDLQSGMTVLEPSAGKGNLADAVRARQSGAEIDTVEMSSTLRELLEAKGYTLVGRDFSHFETDKRYDRVIMNPPFSNGQDADHVRKAYDLLKPGGRLVAITGEGIFFRNDAKAKAFREWFEQVGGTSEKLEGAFTDRREVRTTNVASRMLVINKPLTAKGAPGKATEFQSGYDIGTRIALTRNGKPQTAVLHARIPNGEEWRILDAKGGYAYSESWKYVQEHMVAKDGQSAPSGHASMGGYANLGPGRPSTLRPIEFPELVELAVALQTDLSVVKDFRKDGKVGEWRPGTIRLHADLFKPGKEHELAATLAHEIGHLIDWLPDKHLKRGNVLGRLRTLHSFLKHSYDAKDGDTVKLGVVREELLALSKLWRPWDEATSKPSFNTYRKSGKELYADAISVLLNDPGLLEEQAPTFYKEFFAELDAKPEVADAYFGLQEFLSGTRQELIDRRIKGDLDMMARGDATAMEIEARRRRERELARRDFWFRIRHQIVDKHVPIRDRIRELEKRGVRINQDDNPVYLLEERNYLGGKLKAWMQRHIQPVYESLTEAGIDWHVFGAALMYERVIAGDRSEIANPRGLTPADAQERYDALRARYSAEQLRTFDQAVTGFRKALRAVQDDAYDAGLYADDLYEQMGKNPAYVSFRVIEHLENRVTSRVHKQIGTLKDITNPADATILKALVTMRAVEHQRAKVAAFEVLGRHFPEDVEQAREVWSGKGYQPIEPPDRQKQKLVTYFEKGKLRGKWVDPYIAEALENQSVDRNFAVVSMLRAVNSGVFRPLFTTMNLGFQLFNIGRDFWRFWKNQPDMTIVRAVRRYWEAVPLAKVRAFGLPEKPTADQLKAWEDLLEAEEAGILSITFNDWIRGREPEDTQIEDILVNSGVGGFKAPPRHPLWKPIGATLDAIRQASDFIETLPKAAGIHEYKGQGPVRDIPPETRSFIRRKLGSPDFLAGGTWKPVTNEVFLFSNAIIQAWRADLEVATQPQTRAGFWWKTAAINLVPKVLAMAAIYGWWGGGDDEDDKRTELRRLMRRVSEYDLTNYIIIPLGESGTNTVYLRLPMDDTGRFVGGLFWKLLQAGLGDKDVLASMGQVVDYSAGQFPSVTPTAELLSTSIQYLGGRNPYDAFRGRHLFTDDEHAAGGMQAFKKFVGWQFQNFGGGIVWKFYPGESLPRERTTAQKIADPGIEVGTTTIPIPFASNITGRFLRVTNYGELERLRDVQADVASDEARQRLAERDAINAALREYRRLPADQRNRRWQVQTADAIAARLYPDNPKEREDREDRILKKLSLGAVRGQADPLVDAVLGAGSNDQKVAIIRQARQQMTPAEYQQWLSVAAQQKVISPAVLVSLRKDPPMVGAR